MKDDWLTKAAEQLARESERRAFIKVAMKFTAAASLAVGFFRSDVAAASNFVCCSLPQCAVCGGSFGSACSDSCITLDYSWSCCYNGCLWTCQDCNCDHQGTPNVADCDCGYYAGGASAPIKLGQAQPNHPCYVC